MGLGQQASQSGANTTNAYRMPLGRPQRAMARVHSGTTGGYPANEYNIKRTTTESTESESSQAHYMRHTSSSFERAKGRTFGKSPHVDLHAMNNGLPQSIAAQNWA